MPSSMVPGIWIADWYTNGGLNTIPLTKWWSDHWTSMVPGIWMVKNLMSKQIPMIWIPNLFAFHIPTVFSLKSVLPPKKIQTHATENSEIWLLAYYSMPLENRITRESYPTKGTMSLILQESYRPRILSSLSCKCFCMLDLIWVSKEVLYLTVNLLHADFFSILAAAELDGDD